MATVNIDRLHRIGDGPVATVYSGQHAGRPVALKVLPKRLDKHTLSTYQKEQAKLTQLRRVPSILPVDGIDELPGGEPVLRMELCTQSLAGLVERAGPLGAGDVVVLAVAAATALAAAHGAGVVHGGMSPHNVLYRDTEPVLGDFGVTLRQAFARDPLHAIEFLPPETLRTGVLDESTDLYGLGAVLHYALTGRSPHPGRLGEQPGERVLRILGEPVPAINAPGVPVGLATLVARMLSAHPGRRPRDAALVAGQLARMLPKPPAPKENPDWDDFDAPLAAAPSTAHPPPPALHTQPEGEDLELDDFVVPPRSTPSSRPAPVRPVGPPPVHHSARPIAAPASPAAPAGPAPMPVPAAAVPAHPPAAAPVSPAAAPAGSAPKPAQAAAAPAGPASESAQVAAVPASSVAGSVPAAAVPVGSAPEPAQVAAAPASSVAEPAPAAAAPAGPAVASASPAVPAPAPVPMPAHTASAPALPSPPAPAQPVAVPAAPTPASTSLPLAPPLKPAEPEPPDAAAQPTRPAASNQEPTQRPGMVLGHPADPDDEFSDFRDAERGGVTLLPAGPPEKSKPRRLIRYDLLAGAALVLALLALVPLLLLLRNDPEEIPTSTELPPVGGSRAGDVRVELGTPTDLTNKVKLAWRSTRELDFAVVVAAEGEKTRVLLAERNHSMTVDVKPGRKYCFLVQGSDGDQVYESDPMPLRGATCRK